MKLYGAFWRDRVDTLEDLLNRMDHGSMTDATAATRTLVERVTPHPLRPKQAQSNSISALRRAAAAGFCGLSELGGARLLCVASCLVSGSSLSRRALSPVYSERSIVSAIAFGRRVSNPSASPQ
jgi:hypothetical protein